MAIPQKSSANAIQDTFNADQIALIKSTIFPNATDDELKLFTYVASKTGLDPFSRQIFAVKRKDSDTGKERMTIQTSIDGFRLIAFRSKSYAGKDEAVFEYKDGGKIPSKCKLTVYRFVKGQRCAFTATARWDEYYPGEKMGFMWRKLPETMLEKCCEAKALRMAFPAELSDLHTADEMEQAYVPVAAEQKPIDQPKTEIKPAQKTRGQLGVEIMEIGVSAGLSKDEIVGVASDMFGADPDKLSIQQMEKLLEHMKEIALKAGE